MANKNSSPSEEKLEDTKELCDTAENTSIESTKELEIEEPTTDIQIDNTDASEEDVKIFSSKSNKKKNKEHSPFMKEDDTVSIHVVPGKSIKSSIGHPLEEEEEENNQLNFEEWDNPSTHLEEEDEETSPEGDLELVNQFRQSRENKVRSFKLINNLKLDGEEEPTAPEEAVEEFEEEYVEDFTTYEDAEAVHSELKYRAGKNTIALLVTGIWELLLTVAVFCLQFEIMNDPFIFLIGSLIILGIMIAFNWDMIQDGLDDLKEKSFGVEAAVVIATGFTILHTLIQFFQTDMVIYGALPALNGFAILCTAIARRTRLSRILANFKFISKNETKWAAKSITNEKTALEVGSSAVASGIPRVTFFRPVSFLYKFLSVSYDRHPELKRLRIYIPALWIISAILSVGYGFIFENWWTALQLFGILFCVSIPVSLPIAIEFALYRASKSSLKAGGMLSGRNAVDRYGKLDALVVESSELFPADTVLLHGIKTFMGFRIDQAIMDAAAVLIAADGPLANVFRRIIEDKQEILPPVENLIYEQEMGLSSWVEGKRVFVGNRNLMRNHGIDVPSNDYEARYKKNGRQLVYLSVAGQLSAMFVVSYLPDENVKFALQKLAKENITLLIHTCDSNITEERLAEMFEIDPYYLEILGSMPRIRFTRLLQEQKEEDTVTETVTEIACDNTLTGKVFPLMLCNRLRTALPLTSLFSMLLCVIGIVLTTIYCFVAQTSPSILFVLIYYILSAIITCIAPFSRKV